MVRRLRIAARPAEERFDRLDQRIGMGVVGGVPRARDDGDDAVRQPVVEGSRRVPELRLAVAAEDLEHRLPHLARGHRGRRRGERPSARSSRGIVCAAATRSGQTGSARYAAIAASSMPTTRRRNVSRRSAGRSRVDRAPPAGRPGRRRRSRRRAASGRPRSRPPPRWRPSATPPRARIARRRNGR